MKLTSSDIERFWSWVNKTDTCWLWTGSLNNKGYGNFSLNRKTTKVHRISFFLANGFLKSGLEINHLCQIKSCVNPDHLEEVTSKENIRYSRKRRSHCLRGHKLSMDNTLVRVRKDGTVGRECRECSLKRRREKRALDTGL